MALLLILGAGDELWYFLKVVAEVIVFRNSLSSAAVICKSIHLKRKFCILILLSIWLLVSCK
jgi:hypothetical protein